MEHIGDSDTNSNWCTWNNPQRIDKGTGRLENKRTSGDCPDYSIFKIGQNTEKSSKDLKLAVIQTPVKNHRLSVIIRESKVLHVFFLCYCGCDKNHFLHKQLFFFRRRSRPNRLP